MAMSDSQLVGLEKSGLAGLQRLQATGDQGPGTRLLTRGIEYIRALCQHN